MRLYFILVVPLIMLLSGCGKPGSEQSSALSPTSPSENVATPLTAETLASIKDEDLEEAVRLHMYERMRGKYENAREALEEFPVGLRAIYLTCDVEGEVNNGGFNQYYWNKSGEFANEAVEAFEFFSATKHAALMREANQVHAQEAAEIQRFKDRNTLEAFSESYKVTKLGPLDDRFYKLDEDLSKLRIAKIRSSPELFSK